MTPEITALMLYYGRKNLAEEAIESFLRQTYPHKRLVIVCTHPDGVHFEQDYPEIEVHNLPPDAFENLNEKYNYAFSQIRTNWWCPWDSDDLWMPWHFENIVAGIPQKPTKLPLKVGLPKCYFADNNVINRVGWNMWGNCIYESMDKNGNLYPKCDDTIAKNCDGQILFLEWERIWLRQSPKSFIFRWDQAPHGSAHVKNGNADLEYHKKCRDRMNAIRNTDPFQPHWDMDYVQDVTDFETKQTQRSDHALSNLLR
jgi:hypothetical protein